MSGRLLRLDDYRNKNGNDSGNGERRNPPINPTLEELHAEAERDYFDEVGRNLKHDRIRAALHVLIGDTDGVQQRLREGVEMGGMLRNIPSSSRFPMMSESLAYESEEEFRELTDEKTAALLITKQQEERAEALAAYREWATGLLNDLTLIAETRLSGVDPSSVLTSQNLRMALTTELVSQKMIASISTHRQKVQGVIAQLASKSEAGIKAAPLAETMREIGQLCQEMNKDLEKLSQTATIAAGQLEDEDEAPASHSGIHSLAERARQVFKPFIKGNHVITMQQMRELEGFLMDAGNYNENIGALIQDGIRAIKKAKEEGRHKEVRKIEEFLDFRAQLEGFEGMSRLMDYHFQARAGIVANTSAQNRIILRSTPPEMLAQAEAESGLARRLLLANQTTQDMDLVLPRKDDLELKQV